MLVCLTIFLAIYTFWATDKFAHGDMWIDVEESVIINVQRRICVTISLFGSIVASCFALFLFIFR